MLQGLWKTAVAAALLAACAAPAGSDESWASGAVEAPDEQVRLQPVPEDMWLGVDRFQGALGTVPGKDAFQLSGSFSLPPGSADPVSDVTLTLDQWSVTFPAASWKKLGRTEHYVAKVGNVKADITWWAGGSSRCKYKFSGSKQDLQGSVTTFPEVPVGLAAGGVFDETLNLRIWLTGRGFKLLEPADLPIFIVDKVQFNRNLRVSNKDSVLVAGRIFIEDDFDPATDSVVGDFGPLHFEIPPGTLVLRDGPSVNKVALPGGARLTLAIAPDSGKVSILVTGADLSGLANPAVIALEFVGLDGAAWSYEVTLAPNRPGTVLKY